MFSKISLSEDRYRISVKREPHGAAGAYIDTRVQAGEVLDVSAASRQPYIAAGHGPEVVLTAGIGITPRF